MPCWICDKLYNQIDLLTQIEKLANKMHAHVALVLIFDQHTRIKQKHANLQKKPIHLTLTTIITGYSWSHEGWSYW